MLWDRTQGMSDNGVGGCLRILLVDDEPDLVDLLAFLVQQAGLIPLTATEPAGALALFEKEHPDLALIDLGLGQWNGFELVANLRRRSPKLPIIVLTARGSEDDKVRALDMGADDYVVKPFGHRELIARIRAQGWASTYGNEGGGLAAGRIAGRDNEVTLPDERWPVRRAPDVPGSACCGESGMRLHCARPCN